MVLGDDPVDAFVVDVVGEVGGEDAVLAGDFVGHELLGELVEADFGGGADLHAEDVAAEGGEDLVLLDVDELLGEGGVVVADGGSLSTEDGGRTLEGGGAESHSCTSHCL